MSQVQAPVGITVRSKARAVEVEWPDGARHVLPFEYLRVYSPSAEVRGHGGGEGKLELAKENVRDVYLSDDPDDAALLLDKAITDCLADDVPEIR